MNFRDIFWIKYRIYEPNKPQCKFKPAHVKGFIKAKSLVDAKTEAYDMLIEGIRTQFPKADLKLIECKKVNYDFFLSKK